MAPILSRAVRNAVAMMRSQEWGSESVIPPNSANSLRTIGAKNADMAALSISTVLSCVKALSEDMSTLPFAAYEGDRDGAHARLTVQPQVMLEPFGPDLSVADGIGQIVVSLAMRGNAYLMAVGFDSTGLPDQFFICHPDTVTPFRDKDGKKFRIGGTVYTTRQVVHLTGLMLPGDVAGLDVITAQRVNLQLAADVTQYAGGFFGNGGNPSGVISVQGSGDRKKARDVRDAWEADHSGVSNAHRPAVLFGGATWTPMTVTPENAQFLATRGFLREEICGLFDVPLQRIQAITENASQGGGKGLDAIDAGYVKHGLLPLARNIETAWDALIPGVGTWAKFDFDVFLRASAEVRASVAQIHRVIGAYTSDEIRAREGDAPLPDGAGSDPRQPLNSNTSPTGGADNQPKPGTIGGPTS